MNAKALLVIAALIATGCPAEIGEECGEDASSIAHASVLCEDGSICVDGICVESRKEGEQCVVDGKSYTCEEIGVFCNFSKIRDGFFCIRSKEIGEPCNIDDGDRPTCLSSNVCAPDETWPIVPNSPYYNRCKNNSYCINNLCQKSKNEGSTCYIGDENSCLEIFNCIPSDISILIPISETTLNTIDRTNGVCSPLAQINEPCDPTNYIKCADGLTCNTNNLCEEVR